MQMHHWPPRFAIVTSLVAFVCPPVVAGAADRLPLKTGWAIQSSAKVQEKGDAISRAGFVTDGWHTVTVPNTVVGALVENGTYPDPYFGMNLRSIPGTTYPIGERFTLLPTPAESPFKPSWWYRTEFEVGRASGLGPRAPGLGLQASGAPDGSAGNHTWLHFDGINYRANIWVNGTCVTRTSSRRSTCPRSSARA
jgi:exo-1,4-beta-D-glucosaminidase